MSEPELTTATIEARNMVTDCATIESRIEAFRTRQPSEHPALIIGEDPVATPSAGRAIPEISARELNVQQLRSALTGYGALIVRGMFSRTVTDALVEAADRVIDACSDPDVIPPPGTYYNPPGNLKSIMPNKDKELGNTRIFHRDSGSAMCVEAPCVAEALLQLYDAKGLKELVAGYLGEPPCLSVKKWVLRRSRLPVSEAGWHQDGAFMGTNINSLNMWIPLNECGDETGAPGMDVVPRRLNQIVSADGAQFDWSVSSSQVNQAFAENQPLKPYFQAGDAFFFDHFYLHRTQFRTDFTKIRYAIETWFFGESSFPKNQIPLAW